MKSNSWKIATVALLGVIFVFFGIYFYLTPYLALRNIRQAFIEKDAETVIAHIDFPVFKENFKAELNAKMVAEMAKNADKMKDNPFASIGAGIGSMFATSIVNNIVDTFVSPPAIERMMKGDFANSQQGLMQTADANPFKNGLVDEEKLTIESGYKSFNEFAVDTTDKTDPTKGATLIFQRRGILSWQLTMLCLHN